MSTPMMQQYNRIKKAHPDMILLFRLGDFYEAFNDDAKDISKILGITLTGRGKGENRTPMAGIPHHAMKKYLKKLVESGRKVAIADQVEEAQPGKIVDRQVTKIITAGTISDAEYLDDSTNNYLAAIYRNKGKRKMEQEKFYLSYCDLTTGEFRTLQLTSKKALKNELYRLSPGEILVSESQTDLPKDTLSSSHMNFNVQSSEDALWQLDQQITLLQQHFNVTSLKGFGYSDADEELIPAGVILDYLKQTQKTDLEHISSIQKLNNTDYMKLDPATIVNLELVWPIRPENSKATLFAILNNCQTAMGQRKLRSWILHPLVNQEKIQKRLDAVEELLRDPIKTNELQEILDNYCDLERIVSKLGTGSINARDLLSLKQSLSKTLEIFELASNYKQSLINPSSKINKQEIDSIKKLIDLLDKAIVEDPPVTITEGGMINNGFNEELDEIHLMQKEGKNWLKKLQESEAEKTGITNLKVKFNNVFGYYIEVSKSNLDKVPENYIRKQTLVNAERFIIEELKTWETKILNADSQASELEYKIFQSLKQNVSKHISLLYKIAETISDIDVIANFALIAREMSYTKPKFSDQLVLKNSRHPVVERFLEDQFVPNDLELNDAQSTILLTGPNMSGKSTYIRQIAIIALIAQIGSFVPAQAAQLPVFDNIFTRVGASDSLSTGESTFMIEMNETANILNNATEDSLIILDEIGRGTSTYDGVAIAWSIIEFIQQQLKAKTLFATHYHELIKLEQKFDSLANYKVDIREDQDGIIFSRKVVRGSTDKSYGVFVASMAGVPEEVIKNAKKILENLEETGILAIDTSSKTSKSKPKTKTISAEQTTLSV